MPRNPNTPRLARWISRFHLGTPFKLRSTFSLSLSPPFLSSSHVTLSVVRGCPSEPFKFRTRLLLSRCHFISWTTWTKIHGRKYPPLRACTIPLPISPIISHSYPPSLSLSSFSAPKFKFASRRTQKGVHLVRARKEGREVEEFRARWLVA